MASRTEQSIGIAGAVTLAAIAGVAAGVLLAPKKGSDTRKQIKQRIDLAKERSKERMADAKTKAEIEVDKLKRKTDEASEEASDSVAEARSQVEDTAAEVKARIRKANSPTSSV